jgi:hypothetical protein
VIKFWKMRWAGCVAHTRRGEMQIGLRWRSLKERDHLEDVGIDERIIL